MRGLPPEPIRDRPNPYKLPGSGWSLSGLFSFFSSFLPGHKPAPPSETQKVKCPFKVGDEVTIIEEHDIGGGKKIVTKEEGKVGYVYGTETIRVDIYGPNEKAEKDEKGGEEEDKDKKKQKVVRSRIVSFDICSLTSDLVKQDALTRGLEDRSVLPFTAAGGPSEPAA